MKKMFLALMVMLTSTMAASAMSYEQARNEALFLTDKMAYELNLTDEQYEAAYEINLDYLMGVAGRDDVFGTYWERRNLDLSYILYDWQWNTYIAASYFYRPLYYYYGHRNHFRPAHREHFGMHDRWNRGDFRNPRHSSTRVTGRHHDNHRIESRPGMNRQHDMNRQHNMNRHSESNRGSMNRSFESHRNGSPSHSSSHSGSFGTRGISSSSHSSSSHSHGGGSHSGGSRGGGRR